jgi:hypothetical protein
MIKEGVLKITALFSYCGGPLFITELLKPRFDQVMVFLVTFFPVLLMVLGALFMDDDTASRWSMRFVRAGRWGLYVVLGMHAYALACFMSGTRVSEQGLYYFGITVGVGWSIAYLRAARRWANIPESCARPGDHTSAGPIEPV